MLNKLASAAFAAALALALRSPSVYAQKALVYCPVGIDAAGCERVVSTLQQRFKDGVDRGYDGSSGTLDLKTIDLQHYDVFVVPSLADASARRPYALLREVAPRLRMAITGRVAVYSGAPDQGNGNRPEKDGLVLNLAKWAADGHSRKTGLVGLVALLDLSEDVTQRYSWVRQISAADVSADAEIQAFGTVTPVTDHGKSVLAPGGQPTEYANMASYGLHIGPKAAARTLVAAVAGSDSRQSVLLMFTLDDKNGNGNGNGNGASNNVSSSTKSTLGGGDASRSVSTSSTGGAALSTASAANVPTLTTDKADYLPGQTVTFTGTGWAPGDTVTITIHEDPTWSYPDRQYTLVADASGAFTNHDMIVDTQDLGATFTATAVGNPSGLVAQTTFTDGDKIATVAVSGQSPASITPGQSASYDVSANRCTVNGCTGNATLDFTFTKVAPPQNSGLSWPAGATGTFTPTTTSFGSKNNSGRVTLTISGTTGMAPGSYPFTVRVCSGGGANACETGNGTLIVVAPVAANHAPVLTNPGNRVNAEANVVSLQLAATDVDAGDVLSYGGSNLPPGLNVSSTGLISGTIDFLPDTYTLPYAFTVTVTVSDGKGGSDSENFTWTISNTNRTPVIARDNATVTVNEGQAAANTGTYSDPDGTTPTLTASVGTVSPGATPGTWSWSYTPSDNVAGQTVTITASDGSSSATATFTLNVNNVPPTVTAAAGQSALQGVSTSLTLGSFTDPGTDTPWAVEVDWGDASGKTAFNAATAGSLGSQSHTYTGVGPNTVTVKVTDKDGGTDSKTFQVTITPTTTVVVTAANGVYGGTTSVTATLTQTSAATGVNGKLIAFTLNGAAVCGGATSVTCPTTNSSGVATLSDVSLAGIAVGAYAAAVGATFAGDATYQTSTGTNSLTVNPKPVVITPTSGQTKVFGASDPTALTFTNDGGLTATDFGTTKLARATGENVGPYAISLGDLSAGTNYSLSLAATTVNFTITAKPVVITPTSGQTKVFGASDPTALAFTNDGGLTAASFTGALARASGENVGPYAINLGGLSAGTNYSLSLAATTVNFTITAKPVVITPTAGQTKVFGASDPTALAFTNDGGLTATDFGSTKLARAPGENVGPYAINLGDLSAGTNYSLSLAATTVNFTITAKPVVITPTAGQTKVFGASDPTALAFTNDGGLTAASFTGALARASGENVGPYAINLGSLSAGTNYSLNLAATTVNFTITAKPVVITPTAGQTKVFGASDPTALAFTNDGGLTATDFGSTKLARAPGENVGPYAINLGDLSAGTNYSLSLAATTVNFTITAKPVVITPTAGQTKVFGASDPTALAFTNDGGLTAASFTGALARALGENVGPYAISLGGLSAGTNYSLSLAATTVNFTITAKPVVITPTSGQTKVFGTSDPTALAFTNDGGLTAASFTGALARASGENVGPYAINLGSLSAGTNYSLSLAATTVNFTITAKPVVITPTAGQTKVFGASDPTALTFTNDGGLTAASFTGALARALGENVGPYAINLGSLSAGTNYSLSLAATTVNFTITAKPVMITPTAGQTKVFGASDPTALTFTNDGGLTAASFTGALARALGENVGPYAINLGSLSAGTNYSLSLAATTVNFTITAKPVMITPSAGQTKVFGASDPTALAFTNDGGLTAASFTGALARASGENVGPYAINLGSLSAGTNYSLNLAATTVNFTITAKPVVITPTSGQTKVFGASDPTALAFTNDGGLTAASFTGVLARAPGENVGPYAINLGTLSAGTNYSLNLAATTVNFTITAKPVVITPTAGQTKVFGASNPTALTFTNDGGLTAASFTGALARAPGENVGPYAINLGSLSAGTNYSLSLAATTVNFTIERASTTTVVASSVTPSVFGQSVTFTATVAAVPPGAGTPTGSLQFSIDGSPVGAAVTLNGSGQATYSTNTLPVTNHTVSATYSVSPNFNSSTGSLAGGQTVNQATTTTSVSSSLNPSAFGGSVTFTATVAPVLPGSGTPDGTVQFEIDGTNVGSPVTLSGGQATYSTSSLSVTTSTTHVVKATYSGSTSFVGSYKTLVGGQAVGKAAATTTVTVNPSTAQYSDAVTFTAVISPATINGLNPATTATFKVGTQTMGTASFVLVGSEWKATLTDRKLLETVVNQMAPGTRTVTAVISGINPSFTVSDGSASLKIEQEDASASYSGLLFVSTPSATATNASVTLRATINDITAIDPTGDPNAGDIRNARVKFVNRENANDPAFAGCISLTPVLIDPANTKTGTVSCTVTLVAGSGADPSATYTVGTVVSNYYTDDEQATDELITVTMGGTGFVTGGGYVVSSASSGQYASTAGSKTNFGFNVKFNKSGSNLQGHVNVIVRRKLGTVWKVYQIKSNSIASLTPTVNATGGGTATFVSKANLTDITNPLNPISLGGNLNLEMQVIDKGEPGSLDEIGFTLWSGTAGTSSLLFSNNWVGSKTITQILGGGNLQVR